MKHAKDMYTHLYNRWMTLLADDSLTNRDIIDSFDEFLEDAYFEIPAEQRTMVYTIEQHGDSK